MSLKNLMELLGARNNTLVCTDTNPEVLKEFEGLRTLDWNLNSYNMPRLDTSSDPWDSGLDCRCLLAKKPLTL